MYGEMMCRKLKPKQRGMYRDWLSISLLNVLQSGLYISASSPDERARFALGFVTYTSFQVMEQSNWIYVDL